MSIAEDEDREKHEKPLQRRHADADKLQGVFSFSEFPVPFQNNLDWSDTSWDLYATTGVGGAVYASVPDSQTQNGKLRIIKAKIALRRGGEEEGVQRAMLKHVTLHRHGMDGGLFA
ncbi:hypothetical protein M404DRAFT_5958 [Pisolithus tinctorius Marx 270]|uniref:Uncharacterized protein n=1 Tax=Pisolithus tinctorius Marx 270 TaxID=870435 RepID=A0A0C3PL15_PISTI|nr:hypothetical protein M404DRAFT_5958 [Pisolithus tinctorius Marx 270]